VQESQRVVLLPEDSSDDDLAAEAAVREDADVLSEVRMMTKCIGASL